MTQLLPDRLDEFFAFARERHAVHLRRAAGRPWPWTDDPILQRYRFTNIFREKDRTTVWFRENVRDPLRDDPAVLLATVLFRWFNRTATGEAIFRQLMVPQDAYDDAQFTAWDHFLKHGNTEVLRAAIKSYCGKGPYVTGAYVILGQQGMSKLDGVLKCVGDFWKTEYDFGEGLVLDWRDMAHMLMDAKPGSYSLRCVWDWLRKVPYLGGFMAYEIVSDLRWTGLLSGAPDINTWANPGPGAARGLGRLRGSEWVVPGRAFKPVPKQQMLEEMRGILALSRKPEYWPQARARKSLIYKGYEIDESLGRTTQHWPAWEMREVEHALCESDKLQRLRKGEGRVKGTYSHA